MPYRIRQWWSYKTQMEKILMVLLGFTIMVIIVLASVMKQGVQRRPPPESCTTVPCLTEAIKIMQHTDPNTNPCDDFYQFACGGVYNHTTDEDLPFLLLQTEQLVDFCNTAVNPNDHVITKLAKNLFTTCTNHNEIKANSKDKLMGVLKAAGGWPVLEGSDWNETNFDWKNASYTFRKFGYFDKIFVEVRVDRDVDNATNHILEVVLADVYDYRYSIMGVDKIEIMTAIATIFGAETSADLLNSLSELIEAHNLQQALQALVYYKQNEDQVHHKYTISQYQKLCNSINWLEFINNILGPKLQVTGEEIVFFPPPEIFTKWFEVVLNTPKRAQANYMMWKVIEGILPYITHELQYFNVGLQKRQSRDELCLDLVRNMNLLYPVQVLLHRRYTSEDKRTRLKRLVGNIHTELVQSLNQSKVFSIPNRKETLAGVDSLKILVTPGDSYSSNEILDNLTVEKLDLESGSFLDYLTQATKNYRTYQFLILRNPKMFVPIAGLGLPDYKKEDNIIYALGLATHSIYFDAQRPNYINYATIGSLLGHSLNKVLENAVNTTKTSVSIGKCISENSLDNDKSLLLAQITLGQHITYTAYQNWVKRNGRELPLANINQTPNQLFWMSSTSMFCKPNNFYEIYGTKIIDPSKLVLQALRNNHRFARDFNCPAGSKMYSSVKCDVI